MGNSPEQQTGYSIDYNVIALLVTGQTDKVIEKVEADQTGTFLNDSINFRNDNLLHYACAKNNHKLVEFIVRKSPRLCTLRNNDDKLPSDLTTDSGIRGLCLKHQ